MTAWRANVIGCKGTLCKNDSPSSDVRFCETEQIVSGRHSMTSTITSLRRKSAVFSRNEFLTHQNELTRSTPDVLNFWPIHTSDFCPSLLDDNVQLNFL